MTPATFDPANAASRLIAARAGALVLAAEVLPPDRTGAYAVQDAVLQQLGPIGGWKVGAKTPHTEPACAPLPTSGLLASGMTLASPTAGLRGVEVEVAFRLSCDLRPGHASLSPLELARAIDAVLPVMEVVETRLADWRGADPLAQLADLQTHGALVLGAPSLARTDAVDLRLLRARLAFNGQPVAETRGGNPAADVWRMLAWLAFHCEQRGLPLRAGDIVTTGSCTGMLHAPPQALVQAELEGIGSVEFHF